MQKVYLYVKCMWSYNKGDLMLLNLELLLNLNLIFCIDFQQSHSYIPYTRGKFSSGKIFAVGTQNYHSRENFRGASGRGTVHNK